MGMLPPKDARCTRHEVPGCTKERSKSGAEGSIQAAADGPESSSHGSSAATDRLTTSVPSGCFCGSVLPEREEVIAKERARVSSSQWTKRTGRNSTLWQR